MYRRYFNKSKYFQILFCFSFLINSASYPQKNISSYSCVDKGCHDCLHPFSHTKQPVWEFSTIGKIHADFPDWKFSLTLDSFYTKEEPRYKITITDLSNNRVKQILKFEMQSDTSGINGILACGHNVYEADRYFLTIEDFFSSGFKGIATSWGWGGSDGLHYSNYWFFNPTDNSFFQTPEVWPSDSEFRPDSTINYGSKYGLSTLKLKNGSWTEISGSSLSTEVGILVDEKDTAIYLDPNLNPDSFSWFSYYTSSQWELIKDSIRDIGEKIYYIPYLNYVFHISYVKKNDLEGTSPQIDEISLTGDQLNYNLSEFIPCDRYELIFQNKNKSLVLKTSLKNKPVENYYFQFIGDRMIFEKKEKLN